MARQAVAIADRLYGPDDPRTLPNRFAEAVAAQSGEPEQSIRLYRALAADYERLVGPGTTLATVLNNLGILLAQSGRTDESRAVYERAVDVARTADGAGSPIHLMALANFATLLSRSGDPARARSLMLGILPTLEQRAATGTGADRINHASALGALGSAEAHLGHVAEALRCFTQADASLATVDPSAYPDLRREIATGLAAARDARGLSASPHPATHVGGTQAEGR